ncbi:helix-turn-helix domain-containing protein [Brucella sp. 21LCYQ03]|nr:helix-turn-helix domain-containing protein [Brucella sp. 21LCYQ03]
MWRERLQDLMAKRGLTMRSASIMAGKNHSYIYALLQRKQEPNVDSLVELANAFNVSPIWLIFGMELDEDTERLMLKYQSLDPKRREIVRDMVSAIAPEPQAPTEKND